MEPYDYAKVFGTTGLREHIFAFADNATLATCGRVCSQWTVPALGLLWDSMVDIIPLFKVLAPMQVQNTFYLYPPGYSADWRTFLWYGRLINHFTLNSNSMRLWDTAVNEVAKKRPSFSIMPNLRTLRICQEQAYEQSVIDFSLLLLHDSLHHLTLRIPNDGSLFKSFTGHLLLRTPNLLSLELRADAGMVIDHFQDNLIDLLSGLTQLEVLRVPYYALTSKTINAMKDLPKLTSIVFHDGPTLVTIPATVTALPCLETESFPALTKLQISGSLPELGPFVSAGCFEKDLTSIVLQAVVLERAASLSLLLEIFVQSLPALTRLSINGVPQSLNFDTFPRETMTVTRQNLGPLTAMTRLVEFNLTWPVPLGLSDEGLQSLVQDLPCIEKLSLNCCPAAIDEGPELTLDVLPVISKYCPKLRSLALYVDCTVVPDWNASVFGGPDEGRRIRTLANLKEIDLGLSPLCQDGWLLSMCISKLLPSGCKFVYQDQWLSGVQTIIEGKFGNLSANRWSGKYETLESLTKPLIAARKDERQQALARIEELEERVRTLEAFKAHSFVFGKAE